MTQKKSGVASKHLQEERRRRRHRQVIRNRIIFGAACALVLALIIFIIVKVISAIAGDDYEPPESSILSFEDDNSITFEEVTDFDEDIYDKKDFESQVNSWVDSYNETVGEEAITIEYLKVKNDKAYVVTHYKDAATYSSFTSYPLYQGYMEGAVEAGYDFSDVFVSVDNGVKGSEVETDAEFMRDVQYKELVIIKQNVDVVVHGYVKYVSKYSTDVVNERRVNIAPSDGNMDASDYVYIFYDYSGFNVE